MYSTRSSRNAWMTVGLVAMLGLSGCTAEPLDVSSRPSRPPRSKVALDPRPRSRRESRTRPTRVAAPKPDTSRARPLGDRPAAKARPQPGRWTVRGTVATVSRVVDGDTIEVSRGGRIVDVRLIGVDTPETVAPGQPVGCFGPAASQFTTDSLDGEPVRLEFDVERLDRYGRTLAYVWHEGRLFNQTLVRKGFAQVSTYPPNVKYVDRFIAAQRSAGRSERGLWSACATGAAASDRPGSDSAPTGGAARGPSGCDSNYQGACVPPYPPDLDCGEVSAAGFRSVGSDPHGFDGDGDGVACE